MSNKTKNLQQKNCKCCIKKQNNKSVVQALPKKKLKLKQKAMMYHHIFQLLIKLKEITSNLPALTWQYGTSTQAVVSINPKC